MYHFLAHYSYPGLPTLRHSIVAFFWTDVTPDIPIHQTTYLEYFYHVTIAIQELVNKYLLHATNDSSPYSFTSLLPSCIEFCPISGQAFRNQCYHYNRRFIGCVVSINLVIRIPSFWMSTSRLSNRLFSERNSLMIFEHTVSAFAIIGNCRDLKVLKNHILFFSQLFHLGVA